MKSLVISIGICLLLILGCQKTVGSLNKSEVEKTIAKSNKWRDVSLNDPVDGWYTGSAVTETGEKLNLKVHQTSDMLSTDWKNADGSGGGNSKTGWGSSVSVH